MTSCFKDKNILITGGSSGIGLAGARRIINEGGRVLLTGLNPERLAAAQDEFGDSAYVLSNDAASIDISDLVAAVEAFGSLDGLWLNAGYSTIALPQEIEAQDFDQMMATNVRGPMLQFAALLPYLNSNSSVLVTTSTAVYEGGALTSLYGATKGALTSAARSWANVLAKRGIRVNTLVPGPIESNFKHFLTPEQQVVYDKSVADRVPLGRIGTADEAAAVALFLLSDDASFVTGSQYVVDGGLSTL
ncbi:SDR family oxidoreductase [Streptococcus dentiloxodontae]